MAQVTILAPPTSGNLPAWQFDHMNVHRELFGAMSKPVVSISHGPHSRVIGGGLSRFSALPYVLDPQRNTPGWHFDHGKAHADLDTSLPQVFGITSLGILDPTIDYIDSNLNSDSQLTWWTFANHQNHLAAATLLPQQLTFPFW